MALEALISIKLMPQPNVAKVLHDVEALKGIQWARVAFGPYADVAAFCAVADQSELANVLVKINQIGGVAGTSTTPLAHL